MKARERGYMKLELFMNDTLGKASKLGETPGSD